MKGVGDGMRMRNDVRKSSKPIPFLPLPPPFRLYITVHRVCILLRRDDLLEKNKEKDT